MDEVSSESPKRGSPTDGGIQEASNQGKDNGQVAGRAETMGVVVKIPKKMLSEQNSKGTTDVCPFKEGLCISCVNRALV